MITRFCFGRAAAMSGSPGGSRARSTAWRDHIAVPGNIDNNQTEASR
jgi:hypothetical protein